MEIDNSRISDAPWDQTLRLESEMAIHGADQATLEEAWAHVSASGLENVGLHHEVRDGALIVNRSAVYQALGDLSQSGLAPETQPAEMRYMTRAARLQAMQHLQRHVVAADKVKYWHGE